MKREREIEMCRAGVGRYQIETKRCENLLVGVVELKLRKKTVKHC